MKIKSIKKNKENLLKYKIYLKENISSLKVQQLPTNIPYIPFIPDIISDNISNM